MRVIKVQQGQNLFDVAIVAMGSVMGVLEIAEANNISITGTLDPGVELRVPNGVIDRAVVENVRRMPSLPATMGGVRSLKQKLFENGLFEIGLFE